MARAPKSARALDPSAEAVTGPAAPVASPGEAGPALITLNEVADHPHDPATPEPKGVVDEMSEFLDMLGTDVLRSIHGLQANAEEISRRLSLAGQHAGHVIMADVAMVLGEFRNGLQRIFAPKH